MSSERLRDLESHLELLREQQASLERDELLTHGRGSIQAKQTLRLEVKPKIKEYMEEYWRILSQQPDSLEVSEQDAEIIVAEIVDKVGEIEAITPSYADQQEVLILLREIRDKLNQPGITAAAKLKGVISSIPPFVGLSLETELDPGNFLLTNFPTFTNWIKHITKKKLL